MHDLKKMKTFHNSPAAALAPAAPTKFRRAPSVPAPQHSGRILTQSTSARKSTHAPVEIRSVLIDVPAIRNQRTYLKTNNRPQF
jgi:hypothetical protein